VQTEANWRGAKRKFQTRRAALERGQFPILRDRALAEEKISVNGSYRWLPFGSPLKTYPYDPFTLTRWPRPP